MRKPLIFLTVALAGFLAAYVFGPKFVVVRLKTHNLPAGQIEIAPEKPIALKAGTSTQMYLVRLRGDSHLDFTCAENGQVTRSEQGLFTGPDHFIVQMTTDGCRVTRFKTSTFLLNALSLGIAANAKDVAEGRVH